MKLILGIIGMALITAAAFAADFPESGLPGTARVQTWTNLSVAALPDFKSEGEWPRGIPAQSGGDTAILSKIAGAGSALRLGIYAGSAGYDGPLMEKFMSGQVTPADLKEFKTADFRNLGNFRIQVDRPIENLRSVIFQIRISGMPPSQDLTAFQIIETLFPIALTLNGAAPALPPTTKTRLAGALVNGFYEEIWSYEWTLPAGQTAKSFTVNWTTYPHSVITGLRLIESDSEPKTPQP